MDILKIHKALLERFSLSEILPYYAYDRERELYILSHGVGFAFECYQTWGGRCHDGCPQGSLLPAVPFRYFHTDDGLRLAQDRPPDERLR